MSTRKALVIGIDHYDHVSALRGCVDDAYEVKAVLERNGDGTRNFHCRMMTGTGPADRVERHDAREAVKELFAGDDEIALLFFAGHGHIEATGGYLCASDTRTGDDGLAIGDIVALANASSVKNKIILLDSCHSGIAGATAADPRVAQMCDGLTILTASTASQAAYETGSGGVFTSLLVDALSGAGGDLLGHVTPGSVYAHIDQSLGPWDKQRPIFRTNVKSFVSLRDVAPPIQLQDLHAIATLFPESGFEFPLDPTFEPDRPIPGVTVDPIEANTRRFAILQNLNRVNLVTPVGTKHMFHAAIENRSCKLTVLGEHYRRLVASGQF